MYEKSLLRKTTVLVVLTIFIFLSMTVSNVFAENLYVYDGENIRLNTGNQTADINYAFQINPAYNAETIVKIAEQEYNENPNNHGEKYWHEWYGSNFRFPWCACFVSYCADKAGMIDAGLINKTLLADPSCFELDTKKLGVTPKAGYIVFFDTNNNPTDIDHVGIVIDVNEHDNIITVIEGNFGNKLQKTQFNYATGKSITYPGRSRIVCYGVPQYLGYSAQEIENNVASIVNISIQGNSIPDDVVHQSYYNQRCKNIFIKVNDYTKISAVKADIWTTQNGKDDLQTLSLTPNDNDPNLYEGEICTLLHDDENGEYNIAIKIYNINGEIINEISANASVYMYPRWDLDGNGYIAPNDFNLLIQYLVSNPQEKKCLSPFGLIIEKAIDTNNKMEAIYHPKYDLNNDGKINIADAYLLHAYIQQNR